MNHQEDDSNQISQKRTESPQTSHDDKIPLERRPPPSPEKIEKSLTAKPKPLPEKAAKDPLIQNRQSKETLKNQRKSRSPRKVSVSRAAMKLRKRIERLVEKKEWAKALDPSRRLCEEVPESIFGYINLSFCLHGLGKTTEARDILLNGPEFLKETAVYHYNLACYEAQLKNFEIADRSLSCAFDIDKSYRKMAGTDPDLAEYWIYLHDKKRDANKLPKSS